MNPLGLRNNNPGNIRPGAKPWQGEISQNAGFVVFDTMINGIRALAKLIIVYHDKYGITTVAGIIAKWAPPGDHNDTDAYIAMVCSVLDCRPDDEFDFRNPDFLYWIVTAIGEQENGHAAFSSTVTDADIEAGIQAAILSS